MNLWDRNDRNDLALIQEQFSWNDEGETWTQSEAGVYDYAEDKE